MPPFNYTGHLHPHRLSELRLGYEVASNVKLNPTAINESGKKLSIQFSKLNGSSVCNLMNLVWPQPMCLELPWKLHKLTPYLESFLSFFSFFFCVDYLPVQCLLSTTLDICTTIN